MSRVRGETVPRTRNAKSDANGGSRIVFGTATVMLALIGVALWTTVQLLGRQALIPEPAPWMLAALFLAFVAGELFPLRFDVRAEVLTVSLSELPLVLGVLLLPPWMVGLLYAAAALVAFVARHGRIRSILMNLALISVETSLGFVMVAVANPSVPGPGLLAAAQPLLLPVASGVLLGTAISATAVAAVRRRLGVVESSGRVVVRSTLIAALIIGLTLAGFTLWLAVPVGPILCLILVIAAALLYRGYFVSLRRHADMSELYAFGASVARAGADLDTWQDLARRVREQLGVKMAALFLSDHPAGSVVLAEGPNGPVALNSPPDDHPLLTAAREHGGVIAELESSGDESIRRALGNPDSTNVMIAALRTADRNRGYVGVWDVRPRGKRFADDDLELLQTLAGHLATALDNQRLVTSLQHAAYHDPVTGLVNRPGLQMRGEELVAEGATLAVLLLELDVLSDVTSALGHDHGTQLLITVSQRLADAAGPGAVIGRIDADRFGVLLAGDSDEQRWEFAQRMLAVADNPIVVDGIEVEPTVVGGLATASADSPHTVPVHENEADSLSLLIQHAQLALASARAKDERLAVYRPAIGEVYQRRFQLVSQFRHAVDDGQVTVHYQPKLSLVEKELIGVEALVRWMHPEYGFVSPAELIEAIEPTSAIDVLFAHVLDQSLTQIANWADRGMRIAVAVNLSVRNLLAPNLAATVAAGLARHRVPSELLTLEVTESSVMNQPERSLPVLQELHAMGIRLSVDDFGTGYSSLAYLRRLPIDELKIDRSFVQGMVTDLGDLAIVRAIIDLGHSLGMRVIAEGVEEEAGRDALRSMRCDAMQGFLLSRPLPIDRFEAWLNSRTITAEEEFAGKPALLRLRF